MTVTQSETREWLMCPACRALLYRRHFERALSVCPECGHHARLTATARMEQLADAGSLRSLTPSPHSDDPLGFTDLRPYANRLEEARRRTGLPEAVVCASARIDGHPVVLAVMDFRFMGGSLGAGVGEAVTHAAEVAASSRTPLLLVTASGGARMQEGPVALMQMAKTSLAMAELDRLGVLTICLITDPTYGGVAASFATLGDVILCEPGARMGFAGPRVIEQTIGQKLPEGFQTAEFLHDHGLVDAIVPRVELGPTLANLLSVTAADSPATPGGSAPSSGTLIRDAGRLARRDTWEVVRSARDLDRPTTLDYVGRVLDWFVELHGDRMSGDCPAIVGGLGSLRGRPVMMIGHQKGHTLSALIARNFGRATPDGYRKAARHMRLAAKLGLPVVTLVDTQGAEPGIAAEEQGQAIAIAENIRLMSRLPVPIVAVITGEGGSGGALALAVADRVLALENVYYSVITPEGCAAILWRTASAASQAARSLHLDAASLLRLQVIDGIVPEPPGGANTDHSNAAAMLEQALADVLREIGSRGTDELLAGRARRFRRFGVKEES